jgi:hypothetical protein
MRIAISLRAMLFAEAAFAAVNCSFLGRWVAELVFAILSWLLSSHARRDAGLEPGISLQKYSENTREC